MSRAAGTQGAAPPPASPVVRSLIAAGIVALICAGLALLAGTAAGAAAVGTAALGMVAFATSFVVRRWDLTRWHREPRSDRRLSPFALWFNRAGLLACLATIFFGVHAAVMVPVTVAVFGAMPDHHRRQLLSLRPGTE